jgi:nucleotide-binding universal stress UspA family protein
MPRPALICFDGSEPARSAIRRAGELLGGGPAVVVTVWEPFEPSVLRPVGDTVAVVTGLAKEFDEVAVKVAAEDADEGVRLAAEAGFDASPLVKRGKPRETILDVARELDARAVVLGSRGLGAAESALFGSVSAGVLHHARDIPVLIVPNAGA